jgi:hypothetical protein
MADVIATYRAQVSGLWSTRHRISKDGAELGVLEIRRRLSGWIDSGTYRPAQGEVLHFRRDPGLLRNQFSLWTEGREWLGSSLRWSLMRREIALSTGNKPYRLLPLPSLRRGWRMVAPKTGELARILPAPLGRSATIEVYRKIDFELLLFAYFLGSQLYLETIWPAHSPEDGQAELGKPSKAGGS